MVSWFEILFVVVGATSAALNLGRVHPLLEPVVLENGVSHMPQLSFLSEEAFSQKKLIPRSECPLSLLKGEL